MRSILLILVCLVSSAPWSIAQKQWISITINTLYHYNLNEKTNDSQIVFNNNGIQFTPLAGYFKILRDNRGLGCEVGYSRQNSIQTTDLNNSSYTHIQNKENFSAFYVCPGIFERFAFHNYFIISSLKLPLEYNTNHTSGYISEERDKLTTELLHRQEDAYKLPNTFTVGVFGNVSVQRNVFRNLYFGCQLAIGISTKMTFGTRYFSTDVFDAGSNYERKDETKTHTTLTNFGIVPGISINYFL